MSLYLLLSPSSLSRRYTDLVEHLKCSAILVPLKLAPQKAFNSFAAISILGLPLLPVEYEK